MTHSVCPWWLGYLLASPLRRLGSDPAALLAPFVHPGDTVLEPGPGMGFFTVELARRVGPAGRVVAVDIQPRMLAGLERRLARRGLGGRVEARLAGPDTMLLDGLQGRVDFVLAFAVVHEFPAPGPFFQQVASTLKPGALLLLAEPRGHVSRARFQEELDAAGRAGLAAQPGPRARRSWTALLALDPLPAGGSGA
jgi:SAM-dependent methyltransferase